MTTCTPYDSKNEDSRCNLAGKPFAQSEEPAQTPVLPAYPGHPDWFAD